MPCSSVLDAHRSFPVPQSSFLDSCNLNLLCLFEHNKGFDKDLGLALFLWWLIVHHVQKDFLPLHVFVQS